MSTPEPTPTFDALLAERLAARTVFGGPDDCWVFQSPAGNPRSGHRQISSRGRMRQAHRVAWELANGPIPPGMCVCHSCDNPPCVNPAHLWLGTVADNNRDRDAKGRRGSQTVRNRRAGPIHHGTVYGYVGRKCRCDDCRAAVRAYKQMLRSQGRLGAGTP